MLCKSWFGYVRTYKEVSTDMIMALSVQSLVNALGEQVTTSSCGLCRMKHCQDVHRIAIGIREATISWTRGLKHSEEIFKSHRAHRGHGHPGTEEADLAAVDNGPYGTLALVPPPQQQQHHHAPQMSPYSPVSSEDFPMRAPKRKAGRQTKQVSAKLRMEMVLQERGAMFKKLEAEHNRRVLEFQAQPFGHAQGNNDLGPGEQDTNDEHVDIYLDDDSVSVSERIRPLTYVSPQRSRDGSNCSSPHAPSPSPPRQVDALPAIPPVSPLYFAEFGFPADTAEHSHGFSDRVNRQCDAILSERYVKTAKTASRVALDGDAIGPAFRASPDIAPHMRPGIRAVAATVSCVTHGIKKQNGCQMCEMGTLWEIALEPGKRTDSPEPEPEQV
ncbi:hypothetical protein LX36DRAFT_687318 [Colletotrichum falcatum]|nr:hypothetical protein LX36DRAFT_687318 [Colletotrichum falcatum]